MTAAATAQRGGRRPHAPRDSGGGPPPPLVSVITVAYNAAPALALTMDSVLGQAGADLEYLVIDGGSTDGSLELLRRHDGRIDCWVSERDAGIFDAMNKGIALARGQWLLFMNAGDRFCGPDVLARLAPTLRQADGAVVVYGDTVVDYGGYAVHRRAGAVERLWQGSQFCHQSSLIRRDYHAAHPYNAANRLCADFELFHAAWRDGQRLAHVALDIATIEPAGVSDRLQRQVLAAWRAIVMRHDASPALRLRYELHYALRLARAGLAALLKRRLPAALLHHVRRRRAPPLPRNARHDG